MLLFLIVFNAHRCYSHEEPLNHRLCLKALDYQGCINNSLLNKDIIETNRIWRSYGSISINWSSWQTRNSNHIVAATNASNKPIYIAINCAKNVINTTGLNNQWKGWLPPKEKFEKNLIKDYCSQLIY